MTTVYFRNPWVKWIWVTLILALAVSWPLDMATRSLWGLFSYAPWVMAMSLLWRWERQHP